VISVKVIADSISPGGSRLTTLEVKIHRLILAEMNTHRMFSRNYRSSRAVPVHKLLEEVENDPAMPLFWGRNEPGMSASTQLEGEELESVKDTWLASAKVAATTARILAGKGLHKQIANRVLEPYLWTYGVITSTEWDNFFGLRLDKAAQPEMRMAARVMWDAINNSIPSFVDFGKWHLPYVTQEEKDTQHNAQLLRTSVARCARVSYKPFDADRLSTPEEDTALFSKLVGEQPIHASPAEHQATPVMTVSKYKGSNLIGWDQLRKTLVGEDVAPLPPGYKKAEYMVERFGARAVTMISPSEQPLLG